MAWHGPAWHGSARHGTARPGVARLGTPDAAAGPRALAPDRDWIEAVPGRSHPTVPAPQSRGLRRAPAGPGWQRDRRTAAGRRDARIRAGAPQRVRPHSCRCLPGLFSLLPISPEGEKRGAAGGLKGRAHWRCPALTAPCPRSAVPCPGRCCELRSDGLSSSLPSTPPAQMQWIIFMLLLFISSMEMLSQNRWKKQGRVGAVRAGNRVCQCFCSQLDAGDARGAKHPGRMLGDTTIPCPILPLSRQIQGAEQGVLRCVPSAGQCHRGAVTRGAQFMPG